MKKKTGLMEMMKTLKLDGDSVRHGGISLLSTYKSLYRLVKVGVSIQLLVNVEILSDGFECNCEPN